MGVEPTSPRHLWTRHTRKLLQSELLDVELSIRGILRGFGLKLGEVSKGRFAARVRELVAGQLMLERVIEPMLRAREALRAEYQVLHRVVLAIVREDTTCCRLMTVPGVGALVALTFTSAVDDPARFRRSRAVGAHFGLTPKKGCRHRTEAGFTLVHRRLQMIQLVAAPWSGHPRWYARKRPCTLAHG